MPSRTEELLLHYIGTAHVFHLCSIVFFLWGNQFTTKRLVCLCRSLNKSKRFWQQKHCHKMWWRTLFLGMHVSYTPNLCFCIRYTLIKFTCGCSSIEIRREAHNKELSKYFNTSLVLVAGGIFGVSYAKNRNWNDGTPGGNCNLIWNYYGVLLHFCMNLSGISACAVPSWIGYVWWRESCLLVTVGWSSSKQFKLWEL